MESHIIHKTIKDILDSMNISVIDIIISDEAGVPYFEIKSDESQLLIGTHGETLRALHHLVSRALTKDTITPKFILDVNGYQREHRNKIIEKAKLLGDRVVNFKMDVRMEPAPSYERLLIHELFANHSQIKTESEGYGKDRRLILKYKKSQE